MSIEERQEIVPADYDLTCWYLNARRVIELVGAGELVPQIGRIDTLARIDDATRKSMVLAVLKQSLPEDAKELLARRWEKLLGRDQRMDRAIERGLPSFVQDERERDPRGWER